MHRDTDRKGEGSNDLVARAQGIAYVLVGDAFLPVMESRWKPLRWMDVNVKLSWEREVSQDSVRMLELAGKLLHCICPCTHAIAVPDLHAMNTTASEDWMRFSGIYLYAEDAIVISIAKGDCWAMLDTALHEAMHAAWHTRLSEAHIDMLTQSVAGGLDMPDGYYDSASERVARAFAAWCMSVLSVDRNPAPLPWTGRATPEWLFSQLLSGTYGQPVHVAPSILRLMCGDLLWIAKQGRNLVARLLTA